jgi:hypothetical protein
MAILDLKPNGNIWAGVAIGAGLLLAPVVIPIVAAAARPVAKTALKYGFMLYEKGREMVAEVTEAMEDLAAEAKAEVQAELAPTKGEEA